VTSRLSRLGVRPLQRLRDALPGGSSPCPQSAVPSDCERRRLVAERYFVPWLEEVLPLTGRTVLEYGCGGGCVSSAFAPRCGRYIGLDIDPDEIGAARRLFAERGIEATLVAAPPDRILAETAAFSGEVDVFLCYAVLEHMTVEERLALLDLAGQSLRGGGVIVVIETPNRLTPWDYHTSQLPFMNQLPEELALRYFDRSQRTEFVQALQSAQDTAALRERLTRWGRGVSYHEFELVFGDLSRHVVASSWEPALLPERNIHREELALQRILDQARADLPPAFSRYWLDLILVPEPLAEPRSFVRPWAVRTIGSTSAAYDFEAVQLYSDDSMLAVDLPRSSGRIVVEVEGGGGSRHVTVRQATTGREQGAVAAGAGPAHVDLRFPEPADRYEISLHPPGWITFVGYEG
jgi:2-polyprenyl-3-methyl-5-hydroxy-6-metoxy-1,4-benzoquinol methylase